MDSYQVEVFEYEQADYKSSHADLNHFALTDCMIADAESDVSTILVAEGINEAEYSARYSDFAQLFINGEECEAKGTISLENLEEITVKVVSEDGRTVTEKTYKIQRS